MVATRNYWTDAKCARAFWGQHDLPPYKELLADTVNWAAPGAGENWLDLGCGGGAISKALWEKTHGELGSVLGVDCAAANEDAYRLLRETLQPAPGDRVAFHCHNFSAGLAPFADASFDHAVSGLSISYSESFDDATGRWTTAAYDHLLGEVRRVLRPGGKFVFSVNVPEPSWWKVGVRSLPAVLQAGNPFRFLKKSLRMVQYGRWLKGEARKGRFHYLPAPEIHDKLTQIGFGNVEHCLSYVDQAFIFRAWKR